MINKMNPQRFEQSYLMSKTPYFSGWKSAKIIHYELKFKSKFERSQNLTDTSLV